MNLWAASLPRAYRRLNPVAAAMGTLLWAAPTVLVATLVLSTIGWVLPLWLALGVPATVGWLATGYRLRDGALWIVPWLAFVAAGELALAAGRLSEPALYALFGVAALAPPGALLMSETMQRRWLAIVAPATYTYLPRPDRDIALALIESRDAAGKVLRRLEEGIQVRDFEAGLARAAERASTIDTADAEWTTVRQLWLHYLSWWEGRPPDRPLTDEEFEDLDRRMSQFDAALDELVERRSKPIT